MFVEDTIAAISTAPGEGAIAVLRISGGRAMAIAKGLFASKKPAADLKARTLHFGSFRDEKGKLDEGLLAVFPGPRSYTGEDMAEIHCHGGVLVAARLLESILEKGARAAEPGEFTQRAFINGKMDLTQAEAVMDVIRASTTRALHAAQEQLEGRIGKEITEIRTALLGVVAHLEAFIDFPEEGIDPHTGQKLLADLQGIRFRIESLLATAREGKILREGVRLVLCGKPNAGKSSLLNRLLGFERAIVSEIPGTTRDTIEEFASLRGIPFRITDTAGLRETGDAVEQEGVTRALRAIEQADVVVHVLDATAPLQSAVSKIELVALNKVDLLSTEEIENRKSKIENSLPVSVLTGQGLDELVQAIVDKALNSHSTEAPMLAAINARHQACLKRAADFLLQAEDGMQKQSAPELVSVPLREALDAVGEVVGTTGIEDILGQIFRTFCIGK
ncbi:MAG: tRNA uridine-5-carboxymethylaminomethyl(34) synthesis GTPase MnmE [Verrucomicrobiota bacterium]